MALLLVLLLAFFRASPLDARTEATVAPRRTHIVVWGDSEGVLSRPGKDLQSRNPAVPVLVAALSELDRRDPIDLILCTGDFVRFDPLPGDPGDFPFFKHWPKNLLSKFYPTSGGDEESADGKYRYFIDHVDAWLGKRDGTPFKELTGEGRHPYYHADKSGVHVISLWSPDDPLPGEDLLNFENLPRLPQYRWLVDTLWEIRSVRRDSRPVVILSHRPVWSPEGNALMRLFDAFDVDLVLSGNKHLYAHKVDRGVAYVVSGIMGDRVDGCADLPGYDRCYPETPRPREAAVSPEDHYVEVFFDGRFLMVAVTGLQDGKKREDLGFQTTLERRPGIRLQERLRSQTKRPAPSSRRPPSPAR